MLRQLLADLMARRARSGPEWSLSPRSAPPRMTDRQVEEGRQAVIARYGPWTAHNMHLRDALYTIGPAVAGDEFKLRRVVQAVVDASSKPLGSLRVMDLACLEGMYALEFARHGSEVVAIEGREANIAKARFARDALGLGNVELLCDDVRNFSRASHGEFDVVLCLGILYHLDAPDVFTFLERIAEACTRLAVVDTHVSLNAEVQRAHRGRNYWGRVHVEHPGGASTEEKEKQLWASLDNEHSFFPTRTSLLAALTHAGFTSIHECHVPFEPAKANDRVTLLAIKGSRVDLQSAPMLASVESGPTQEEGMK